MDATGTEISVACAGIICYVLLFRDVAPLWLDVSLGGMSALYIISDEPKTHIQTFVLLFACLKLFSNMILLPVAWMAKPFGMLFAVINTVIESGILILVVVTFGVCFHIEFGNSTETTNATDTLSLNFDALISSLMKSFIMSTGEYDASSANITSLWQYLLLFVFVIIVGISLFNLLVAKALNDIQLIQNQAEICTAIYRINIVKTYERLNIVRDWNKLTRLCKKPSHNVLNHITMRKFKYPLKMTFYYTNIKDCNSNIEANATDKGTTDHSIDFVSPKKRFFGLIKMHNHLDYNSFKRVLEIAEKNSKEEQQTNEEEEQYKYIEGFGEKLNQLEIAMKDQMNSIQISLQQHQTETIKRIETILQEIRHTN
ncbi:transient receptor potential cation channel protein painless-like [Drosophila albomicans]|uniref:Transient receptor potential cation channel protein painless-like n=1 Tax=Drosophila albomicans TaxID=7291 RepID=A0A9C6WGF6_DROAB|nr:transient receptor potential cation channel protein painless-like [Drosophila albomicans]